MPSSRAASSRARGTSRPVDDHAKVPGCSGRGTEARDLRGRTDDVLFKAGNHRSGELQIRRRFGSFRDFSAGIAGRILRATQ